MPEIGEGMSIKAAKPALTLTEDFLVARIVHYLQKHFVGKTLAAVKAQHDENVFGKVGTSAAEFEKALKGKRVVNARRQGKYFWYGYFSICFCRFLRCSERFDAFCSVLRIVQEKRNIHIYRPGPSSRRVALNTGYDPNVIVPC